MAWQPADQALAARFDRALPDDPRVERKRMFGFPSCFVHGRYVCGLHEARLVLRLQDGAEARFPELADAAPFVVPGGRKPIRDWCVVPPAVADDAEALARLLRGAVDMAAALPPKTATRRATVARRTAKPGTDARPAAAAAAAPAKRRAARAASTARPTSKRSA